MYVGVQEGHQSQHGDLLLKLLPPARPPLAAASAGEGAVRDANGLRASRVKSAVFMPAGMSERRPESGPLEVLGAAAAKHNMPTA